jgi:hypothetical protein
MIMAGKADISPSELERLKNGRWMNEGLKIRGRAEAADSFRAGYISNEM